MVKGEESFTAIRARVDSDGRKRKERGKGKEGKSIFLFLDIGETRGGGALDRSEGGKRGKVRRPLFSLDRLSRRGEKKEGGGRRGAASQDISYGLPILACRSEEEKEKVLMARVSQGTGGDESGAAAVSWRGRRG